MRSWLARRVVVVLAVVTMFAVGGSVVLAAIPSGGGVIHACYGKTTGAMRVIDYPRVHCASSERLLSWTQVGPKAPPLSSIGIKTVGMIDSTFDENPDPANAILSVWVETGSASTACLATLNEALHAPAVDQLYCSSRTVTFPDTTVHRGLYLHMMLAAELPVGMGYWVNVYQEGAKFYGQPRTCDLPGCN
jgi:hypothetical protein